MATLDRRLAVVEAQTIVLGLGDRPPAEVAAEQRREIAWHAAAKAVLASMPVARAAAVVVEVAGRDADDARPWSPITRRVVQLAWSAVPSSLPECQFGDVCW